VSNEDHVFEPFELEDRHDVPYVQVEIDALVQEVGSFAHSGHGGCVDIVAG
jgi:hypothetical protein